MTFTNHTSVNYNSYDLDLKNENVTKMIAYLTGLIPVKSENSYRLYNRNEVSHVISELISRGDIEYAKSILKILEKKEVPVDKVIKYVSKSIRISPPVYYELSRRARVCGMPNSHIVGNLAINDFYNVLQFIESNYQVDSSKIQLIKGMVQRWGEHLNKRGSDGSIIALGRHAEHMKSVANYSTPEYVDFLKQNNDNGFQNPDLYNQYDPKGMVPDWEYTKDSPERRIFWLDIEDEDTRKESMIFRWAFNKKFEHRFPNKEYSSKVMDVLRKQCIGPAIEEKEFNRCTYYCYLKPDGIRLTFGIPLPLDQFGDRMYSLVSNGFENVEKNPRTPVFSMYAGEKYSKLEKMLVNEFYPEVLGDIQKSLDYEFEGQAYCTGYYIHLNLNFNIRSDLEQLYINETAVATSDYVQLRQIILLAINKELSEVAGIPIYDFKKDHEASYDQRIQTAIQKEDINEANQLIQDLEAYLVTQKLTELVMMGLSSLKSEVITITMPRCLSSLWDAARGKDSTNDFVKGLIRKNDQSSQNNERKGE